ncbi:glycosyltransferase family 39 protein [Candidatus Gottesmanbacteria bacterium]|nr:glycosyltransferase family 39 protein [Candidatus Gottesmanbacteria bacterium]
MKKKGLILALLPILVLAFSFRIWGINRQLPYLYHPDEPIHEDNIVSIVENQPPNVYFFHYPSLFFNIQSLALNLFLKVSDITKYPLNPNIQRIVSGNGYTSSPAIFLFGRMVTLLFSLGLIILIYMTTLLITKDVKSALFSALLSAVSPVGIENATLITPDTMVGFFTMAAILSILILLKRGSTKYYLLSGLLVGLATSIKYNAIVLVPLVAITQFARRGFKGFITDWRFYLSLVFVLIGFFIGTPQMLTATGKFIGGIQIEMEHYSRGHPGAEGNSLFFYLSTLIKQETAAFLFFLISVFVVFQKKSKDLLIILLFIILYFVFISIYPVYFQRNLMPLLPPLYVLSAIGVTAIFNRLGPSFKPLITILAALLISISLTQAISVSLGMTTDKKIEARRWIEKNIPDNSNVIVESYGPWVDPGRIHVQGLEYLIDYDPQWYISHKVGYLIASEESYGRFFNDPHDYSGAIKSYEKIFKSFPIVASFGNRGFTIRIYKVTPE